MHLNDFYEFGSIKLNSKKHRNIEKIRFGSIELIRLNSIRFGSIFQESSRVSLYSISGKIGLSPQEKKKRRFKRILMRFNEMKRTETGLKPVKTHKVTKLV